MDRNDKNKLLSTKVRLLVGIFSIPSLMLASMILTMTLNGRFQEVGYFEWIYSLAGFIAIYIAVTGKRLF